MAGSRSLTRLEHKFMVLRQRQEAMQSKFKEEIRKTQKAIEGKRSEFIMQSIHRIDFPLDKPVLLIGALLDAKERMDGSQKADTINRYIKLYNEFAAKHPNLLASSEETGEDTGKAEKAANQVSMTASSSYSNMQEVSGLGRESQS